jgi:hypothetical protein
MHDEDKSKEQLIANLHECVSGLLNWKRMRRDTRSPSRKCERANLSSGHWSRELLKATSFFVHSGGRFVFVYTAHGRLVRGLKAYCIAAATVER